MDPSQGRNQSSPRAFAIGPNRLLDFVTNEASRTADTQPAARWSENASTLPWPPAALSALRPATLAAGSIPGVETPFEDVSGRWRRWPVDLYPDKRPKLFARLGRRLYAQTAGFFDV